MKNHDKDPRDEAFRAICALRYSMNRMVAAIILSLAGKDRKDEMKNSFFYAFNAVVDLSLSGKNFAEEIDKIIDDEFGAGIKDFIEFSRLDNSERDLIESVFEYVGYSMTGASAHKAKAWSSLHRHARELSAQSR